MLDYQGDASTADVLMETQLRDPDRDMSRELDVMLSPELLSCLMWTGPRNPLDQSVWDDSGDLGPDCERAFAAPWLVVVRTVVYDLPETIELEVFVVDMGRRAFVAGFPLALRGRYRRQDLGRGPWAGEAERQLRSDAFVVARCEIARRLDELPGTTIGLSEAWAFPGIRNPCAKLPKTFSSVR
jgi:hypothetical protein